MVNSLPNPPGKVSAAELEKVLSSCTAFSDFSAKLYGLLAEGAKREFVPAGTRLIKYGDFPEDAVVVEHGRFMARIPRYSGESPLVFELGRGHPLMLATMLSQEPFRGEVYALRDSKVIHVPRSSFLSCIAEEPELLKSYSKWVIQQTLHLLGKPISANRPLAFAILPSGNDPQIGESVTLLMQALSTTIGRGHLIDSQRVQEAFAHDPSRESDFERVRYQLTAWLEEQEAEGHFLLFVCDPTDTHWTRWCLNQTSRIAVVVKAGDTRSMQRIDEMFAGRKVAEVDVKVDLVLVQERNTALPRGTGAWLDLKSLHRHHHVRCDNLNDYKRVARLISCRPVGIALGGGGARGLAHIGVLQALEEKGVPIDVIGGTSMGSVIAAAYARGWSPREILELSGKVFADTKAVRDLGLPILSILAGRKLNSKLQSLFGDIDISDLWLPFFCVSSSLSEGEMVVHERGLLWKKVRASCSLPGIFPPVRTDGQLLVDGGVMNNVPLDVMEERCKGGTVVAVNVGGGGAKEFASSEHWETTGWDLLRHSFVNRNEHVANILDVMLWSTTLSSKRYLQQLVAAGRGDLYLTPPVQGFQLLGFDSFEELYKVGYEYACKQLEEWDDLSQVTASV